MKIYRIYKEETECIPSDVYDEDGYIDERYDEYEVVQTTIKYVDSFEKVSDFIDNCGIKEDIYYEEIEVE
jgi:hypothetical protein